MRFDRMEPGRLESLMLAATVELGLPDARGRDGMHRLSDTRPRSVLSEAEVRSFERQHGVTLPREYREFLMTVGDGGPGPYHGIWSLSESYGPGDEAWWPGFLATPFLHTQAVNPDDLDDDYDQDRLVTGSMIISDMGCGAFVRLVVTGTVSGQVWFDTLGIDDTLTPGPAFGDWYRAWAASWPRRVITSLLKLRGAAGGR
ncbi:SMI1/KNR4 family protein [Streptomyces cyslabdanicus]|uniref:SMI1/KNR4 family protein n=1 Tax=Streptomyces cyslabdanicus TaxID=1470456 RepID=UPI004044581D